jgi:hypothetical protein
VFVSWNFPSFRVLVRRWQRFRVLSGKIFAGRNSLPPHSLPYHPSSFLFHDRFLQMHGETIRFRLGAPSQRSLFAQAFPSRYRSSAFPQRDRKICSRRKFYRKAPRSSRAIRGVCDGTGQRRSAILYGWGGAVFFRVWRRSGVLSSMGEARCLRCVCPRLRKKVFMVFGGRLRR